MGDVLVADATPLKIPRGGSVLIDSDAGPLLGLAARDAFEDAVLGFVIVDEDVGQVANLSPAPAGQVGNQSHAARRYLGTNWLIRPSFPVFVLNLLEYLGGSRDVLETGGVRPGMPVSLDVPSSQTGKTDKNVYPPQGAAVRVSTPSGRVVEATARSGKVVFDDTGELGVYEVQVGGKTVQRFAVNLFDPAESAIRPDLAPTIKIGDVKVTGEMTWEPGRREVWKYLAAAGLVILLLEWYIYIRRIY